MNLPFTYEKNIYLLVINFSEYFLEYITNFPKIKMWISLTGFRNIICTYYIPTIYLNYNLGYTTKIMTGKPIALSGKYKLINQGYVNLT